MTEPLESFDKEPEQRNVQTAVIYARVSTDDSDQTVENQLPLCRKYCEEHGYKVLGEYYEDYTGSTINRPKFLEMLGRLELRDINYVVAYDQSRLTRCKETRGSFAKVQELINGKGAMIRFVASDIDPHSEAGEILTSLNNITNANYNIELAKRTSIGMQTRKKNGEHVGRPAAFMFTEDIEGAPEGRFQKADPEHGIAGTKTAPEAYVMSFAKEGISLRKAAELIGVSVSTLIAEMKPQEETPSRRLKKVALAKAKDPTYQIKDTDYVTFYRYKGTKDRYSEYMTLYEQAVNERKGVCAERVGNDPEICSEKVVE